MGKNHNESDNSILSALRKDKLNEMADQIDQFIEFVDKFLFIEGCTDEEYKKIIKRTKKASKRLRKQKDLDKVFDVEKLEECIMNDTSFANEYLDMDKL